MPAPKDPGARALWIERARAAKLGKKLGPQSSEHRAKIAAANRGQKRSDETRQRLRESHLGKSLSESAREKLRQLGGEKNGNWKGSDITYTGAHRRVLRAWGRQRVCLGCGCTEGRIQAALRHDASEVIDRNGQRYSPWVEDYVALCGPCHNAYDRATRPAYIETQKRVVAIVASLPPRGLA